MRKSCRDQDWGKITCVPSDASDGLICFGKAKNETRLFFQNLLIDHQIKEVYEPEGKHLQTRYLLLYLPQPSFQSVLSFILAVIRCRPVHCPQEP